MISGTYQLPVGRGKEFGKNWSRAVDALIGGWQVNGIYTLSDRIPDFRDRAEHLYELRRQYAAARITTDRARS